MGFILTHIIMTLSYGRSNIRRAASSWSRRHSVSWPPYSRRSAIRRAGQGSLGPPGSGPIQTSVPSADHAKAKLASQRGQIPISCSGFASRGMWMARDIRHVGHPTGRTPAGQMAPSLGFASAVVLAGTTGRTARPPKGGTSLPGIAVEPVAPVTIPTRLTLTSGARPAVRHGSRGNF